LLPFPAAKLPHWRSVFNPTFRWGITHELLTSDLPHAYRGGLRTLGSSRGSERPRRRPKQLLWPRRRPCAVTSSPGYYLRSPPKGPGQLQSFTLTTCALRETCLAKRWFREIGDDSTCGRSMVSKSARTPNARSRDPSRRSTSGGGPWPDERQQYRERRGSALRVVFSSHDNWKR
jgi:hypothetical protein